MSSIITPQNAIDSIVVCSQFLLTISKMNNIGLAQKMSFCGVPFLKTHTFGAHSNTVNLQVEDCFALIKFFPRNIG